MSEQTLPSDIHIQNKDIVKSWYAVGKSESLETDEMIAAYLINLYLHTTKTDSQRNWQCMHCNHSLLSSFPGLQKHLQQKDQGGNKTVKHDVSASHGVAVSDNEATVGDGELPPAASSTSDSVIKLSREVLFELSDFFYAEKLHGTFPSTVSTIDSSVIKTTESSYSDVDYSRGSAEATSITENDIENSCVAGIGPYSHSVGERNAGNTDISSNSQVPENPGEDMSNDITSTSSKTPIQARPHEESSDSTTNRYIHIQEGPNEECNDRKFHIKTSHDVENNDANNEKDVGYNKHSSAVSHNTNVQPNSLERKHSSNDDQIRSTRKRKVGRVLSQVNGTSASSSNSSKTEDSSCLLTEKPASCALNYTSGNDVNGASTDDCDKPKYSQKEGYCVKKKKRSKPVCPECKATFTERNSLKSHMLIHTGEKPFQCSHCDMCFRQKTGMKTHLKQVHSTERPFQCPHCPKDFKLKKSLKSHIICHQPGPLERPFQCKECPAAFTNNSHLKRHVLIHKGDKPFLCTDCGRSYSQAANLKTHIESRHLKNFRYFCEKCGKGFLFNHELQKHTVIHKEKEKKVGLYMCETCGKSLKSYKVLIQHVAVHTDVRPYSCEECEKNFKTRLSLNSHKKSHIVSSVECEFCGKGFKSKNSLNSHKKSHAVMSPVVCECCGKSYNSKVSLYNHKKTHSAIRPFVCEMCGKTFKGNAALKMHSKTHTDARPYCCETCGKSFKARGVLNVHKKSHHLPKKMYECETCGKAFKRHSSLANHKRIHRCENLCVQNA